MKNRRFVFLSGIIFIAAIAFLILLNDITISIRLNELKNTLQKIDQNESSMENVAMLATYEINKKLFEKRISQNRADEIEQTVLSHNSRQKNYSSTEQKYKILSVPALMIINFNRMIIGKSPLKNIFEINTEDLYIAYYYERNYLFNKAIKFYKKALTTKGLSNSLKARITLHMGYCYALTERIEEATNSYEKIIKDYSQEKASITAIILLEYLKGFSEAKDRILKESSNPISMGKDLVNLLAYDKALSILNKAKKKSSKKNLPSIRYFQARCYSGLGRPKEAVDNYLKIITETPLSEFAKYSNRKLFLIGTREEGENSILKLSKKINKRLRDPILTKIISKQKTIKKRPAQIMKSIYNNIDPEILKETKLLIATTTKKIKKEIFFIIKTSDGNTFKGTLVEENKKIISLKTSIGIICIKKEKITSMVRK